MSLNGWAVMPNGMIWRCRDGWVTGSVGVPDLEHGEDFLDALCEAATGSIVGLEDISVKVLGGGLASFSARLSESLEDEGALSLLALPLIHADRLVVREGLMDQYGVDEAIADHMALVVDEYADESVRLIHGTNRAICTPSSGEIDYVRVTADGIEIGYWTADEIAEDPSLVLGALMGATAGA